MSRKKVALVAGTRPEAVKLAPVYFALRESAALEPVLLSSGQHRQMLDQTLGVFGLRPDLDLNLMQPGQTLPDLTARVITQVGAALRELRPAAILAQGDTTTVLGAALAAFYERIPLGHVEAGLRTYDFEAPWPEEMNRRLADPIEAIELTDIPLAVPVRYTALPYASMLPLNCRNTESFVHAL